MHCAYVEVYRMVLEFQFWGVRRGTAFWKPEDAKNLDKNVRRLAI